MGKKCTEDLPGSDLLLWTNCTTPRRYSCIGEIKRDVFHVMSTCVLGFNSWCSRAYVYFKCGIFCLESHWYILITSSLDMDTLGTGFEPIYLVSPSLLLPFHETCRSHQGCIYCGQHYRLRIACMANDAVFLINCSSLSLYLGIGWTLTMFIQGIMYTNTIGHCSRCEHLQANSYVNI
jgi:hypothetical protein